MQKKFSFCFESNENNLLTGWVLTNEMRLLEMSFQRHVIFIISPTIFVFSAKETLLMILVQMILKLIIIEQMYVTELAVRM
jgi:hypothetical protein